MYGYLSHLLTRLGGAKFAEKGAKPSDSCEMDTSASPTSTDKDIKSLDLPVSPIIPFKTCPKCEDIVKTGGPLHFTLAYSRCRCHRSWKYNMPSLSINATTTRTVTSAIPVKEKPSNHHLYKSDPPFIKPILAPPSWSRGSLVKRYYMTKTATGRRGLLPPLKKIIQTERQPAPLQSLHDNATPYNDDISYIKTHKQVSFVEPTQYSSILSNSNSNNRGSNLKLSQKVVPPPPVSSSLRSSSSIPSLPQIQNSTATSAVANGAVVVGTVNTFEDELSSDSSDCCTSEEDTNMKGTPLLQPVRSVTFNNNKMLIAKNFELVHLVRHVPTQQKVIGSDLFDCLDQNGDGHLTFTEVLSGLTDTWQNVSAIIKLEHYLKPLYHVLGDDTYFSKRDFVLCYGLTQIFKERNTSIPYLANVDKQFYTAVVKPLMVKIELLQLQGKVDISHVSLATIEIATQKLNTKPHRITFNTKTANKLKKHSNGFQLLEILLFSPYIFSIHK